MFDADAFLTAKLRPRTADVAVPGLREFFRDSEPVWKVRGLTGQELGQAKAAVAARKDLAALIDGIVGGAGKERSEALRKILDLNEEVPPAVAMNIHVVRLGSADPAADEETAVKLCACFPIEFQIIANKILELTGAGHEPGKAGASGETPPSGAL